VLGADTIVSVDGWSSESEGPRRRSAMLGGFPQKAPGAHVGCAGLRRMQLLRRRRRGYHGVFQSLAQWEIDEYLGLDEYSDKAGRMPFRAKPWPLSTELKAATTML